MARYESSTQRKTWTFASLDVLESLREAAGAAQATSSGAATRDASGGDSGDAKQQTAKAEEQVEGKQEQVEEAEEEEGRAAVDTDAAAAAAAAAASTATPCSSRPSSGTASPRTFSPEDERRFRRHYEKRIFNRARHDLRLPRAVCASAVHLFKRFFLHHAVLDYDVELTALTSIYLASKIDEHYRSAADVSADREDAILAHEMVLLRGLRFQAVCHHPYMILEALLVDGAESEGEAGERDAVRGGRAEAERALARVDAAVLTDAPLLMSPAALALTVAPPSLAAKCDECWRGREEERERCRRLVDEVTRVAASDDAILGDDDDGGGEGDAASRNSDKYAMIEHDDSALSSSSSSRWPRLHEFYLAHRHPLLDPASSASKARRRAEEAEMQRQHRQHLESARAEERRRAELLLLSG